MSEMIIPYLVIAVPIVMLSPIIEDQSGYTLSEIIAAAVLWPLTIVVIVAIGLMRLVRRFVSEGVSHD